MSSTDPESGVPDPLLSGDPSDPGDLHHQDQVPGLHQEKDEEGNHTKHLKFKEIKFDSWLEISATAPMPKKVFFLSPFSSHFVSFLITFYNDL